MPEQTFTASMDFIPKAMDFLRSQLGEKHAALASHVELAVEELLINIVNYAYPDISAKQTDPPVFLLGCRWVNLDGEDQFGVWIKDWGRPFDPFRQIATPDTSLSVEEREIGGLGVHLVKHITSHYAYSGSDGSNTVEVYFSVHED
ncbi:MAG: ATP-binding protein [Desulfovibrio sp.]|nr:ATP-binding protein [Desulfovibrio sp.]